MSNNLRIVYGPPMSGKAAQIRIIYRKKALPPSPTFEVKRTDYSEKNRKNNIEAYLPIFYGMAPLQGHAIWVSEPVKATLVGYGGTKPGMVYFAVFAVAADCYEMVQFPYAETGNAYVNTLTEWGGAISEYPFGLRTDWIICWHRDWTVITGASVVQGRGKVFPALYKGDGGSGEWESYMRLEGWDNWITYKTYEIPRSVYDQLTAGQQWALTNSWMNEFYSETDQMPFHTLSNGGDLYAMVNIQNFVNIGNGDKYTPEMGQYASKMPGIATFGCTFAQLDDEELQGPTIKIWGSKQSTWYKEIILDLIHRAGGHDITQYTKANFNVPNDDNPEYRINYIIDEQITYREAIEDILDKTGTVLYYNERYYLKEKYPTDYTVAATLNQNEIGFELSTQEMEEIPRIYKGYWERFDYFFMEKFKEEVSISNDSLATAYGPVDKNVDISSMRTEEAAINMITKVMKNEAWPKFYGTIETAKSRYGLRPGDVITLNLPDYLPYTIDMQITKKETGDETITFDVEQVAPISSQNSGPNEEYEEYTEAGIPVIDNATIIEIPENTRYEHQPAHLLAWNMTDELMDYLAVNSGFVYQILLYKSATLAGPYALWQNTGEETIYRRIISARGNLIGSIYADGRERTSISETDHYIEVANLDYETAMAVDDIAILKIGNEYIMARAVSKVGAYWRFYGLEKRQLGSEPDDHAPYSTVNIFICHPGDSAAFGFDSSWTELDYRNILITDEEMYIKPIILKKGLGQISSISNTPAVHIDPAGTANIPLKPGRIKAVRTGASVAIDWHPRSYLETFDGAGIRKAEDQVPPTEPWPHEGDFKYRINGSGWVQVSAYTLVKTDASAFTIDVVQHRDGIISEIRTCAVGAADGTYIDGIKID